MKAQYDIVSLLSYPDEERLWAARSLAADSDRAFDRARRRASLRRIARAFGFAKESARITGSAIAVLADETSVPIDAIAGIAPDGAPLPLPGLSPYLRAEWRRAYAKEDLKGYAALEACEINGALYLCDGAASLIMLELLRETGQGFVRVVSPRPVPVEPCCRMLGIEPGCRGFEGAASPGIAC